MGIKLDLPYTKNFMLGAMTNRAKLQESTYFGLIDSADLLMDVDLMLKEANLTAKQSEVVELYFFNQLTQEEVAKHLNISQQAVLDHINKAKDRVTKVIERWGRLDAKYNNK